MAKLIEMRHFSLKGGNQLWRVMWLQIKRSLNFLCSSYLPVVGSSPITFYAKLFSSDKFKCILTIFAVSVAFNFQLCRRDVPWLEGVRPI